MTPDLERIETLAKAATGGEWTWEDNPPTVYAGRTYPEFDSTKPETWCGTHGMNLLGRLEPDWNGKNNLNFICAANPQTVLALVARVRELEKAAREVADEWAADGLGIDEAMHALISALDGAKGGKGEE